MKKTLSFILIFTLLFALAGCGTKQADADKESDQEETVAQAPQATSAIDPQAQRYLEEALSGKDFTGIFRVTKNGAVVCEKVGGTLTPDSTDPVTADTLFSVGSVSKQFCAAAVMLLQQDGKLSVNDTVDKYFPSYVHSKEITVKNLLTMRSGIPDYIGQNLRIESDDLDQQQKDDNILLISPSADEAATRQTIREWIFRQELDFDPDSDFSYSNSNYFLLAEIVEQVSDTDYGDFLKTNIFTHLEMTRSGILEDLHSDPLLAKSPPIQPGFPLMIDVPGFALGAGSVVTTAGDMDKWLNSLRDNTILTRSSITEMTTDYSPSVGYGYGFIVMPDGGIGHNGSIDTCASYVFTVPEEGYNFFCVITDQQAFSVPIQSFALDIIDATRSTG